MVRVALTLQSKLPKKIHCGAVKIRDPRAKSVSRHCTRSLLHALGMAVFRGPELFEDVADQGEHAEFLLRYLLRVQQKVRDLLGRPLLRRRLLHSAFHQLLHGCPCQRGRPLPLTSFRTSRISPKIPLAVRMVRRGNLSEYLRGVRTQRGGCRCPRTPQRPRQIPRVDGTPQAVALWKTAEKWTGSATETERPSCSSGTARWVRTSAVIVQKLMSLPTLCTLLRRASAS